MTLTLNVSQPELYQQARRLWLFGLLKRWEDVVQEPWLKPLLDHEMEERRQRSLQRRLHNAKLGDFKPLADFQWDWPTRVDRQLLEEIFTFQFVAEAANVVLVGANGLGKTMIAQNLAHQAVLRGLNVVFTTASNLLNDLASQESTTALTRRLRFYYRPHVLVIDEVGYLAYDNRYADLLFEVVNQRYRKRSVVLTTNKPFGQWTEVFPNAASVVTLIDRLVHQAEIVQIEGESFRLKEAQERAAARVSKRMPSNTSRKS